MKNLAFGLDIGGINTVFGLVDKDGEIIAESTISTAAYKLFEQYPSYVSDLCTAMKNMLASLDFEHQLVGIGISAPNANYRTGCISTPANLWKYMADGSPVALGNHNFNFVDDFRVHFPDIDTILLTNDANAATIGEMMFGNAKGMSDFIMITLGTGVGSGFVANGEMIYGHDGMAGEYGHVTVEHGGRVCGCGRRGCLETYTSATGVKRTVFALLADRTGPSVLRNIPYSEFDTKMVYDAALQGDAIALETFRFTGEMLGRALANVVTVTSPEAIILFGGLTKAGKFLLEPTSQYMEENMLFTYKRKVKLLTSGIQDKNVAVMGAAALVWQSI